MATIPCKLFSEHQWAFYYWAISGIKNASLIHCDTHADLSANFGKFPKDFSTNNQAQVANFTKESLAITNFIVPALELGIVKEVFWVLPEWAKRGTKYEQYYWDNIAGGRTPQSYVEKISELLPSDSLAQASQSHYVVHKVYLPEIPDNLNNIILDIDLDYFSCTGFDTFGIGLPRFSTQELVESIHNFVKQFKADGRFVPQLITMATSPNYTPLEHIQLLPKLLIKEFVSQGLSLDLETDHITYNLEVQVLVKNLRIKIEHLLREDPRSTSGFDDSSQPLLDYWNRLDNLDQYFIPPECYQLDDFKIFLENPLRNTIMQNKDFSAFFEQLKAWEITSLPKKLELFVNLYLIPKADWNDIVILAHSLFAEISAIENNTAKFDQRVLKMINAFKVKQQVDRKNAEGFEKLMNQISQFEKEL